MTRATFKFEHNNNHYGGTRQWTIISTGKAATRRTEIVAAMAIPCLGFCRVTTTCVYAGVFWWARTASLDNTPSRHRLFPLLRHKPPGWFRRRSSLGLGHCLGRLHHCRHRRHRHGFFAADDRSRHHRCVCNPIANNYRLHRKAYWKEQTNNG